MCKRRQRRKLLANLGFRKWLFYATKLQLLICFLRIVIATKLNYDFCLNNKFCLYTFLIYINEKLQISLCRKYQYSVSRHCISFPPKYRLLIQFLLLQCYYFFSFIQTLCCIATLLVGSKAALMDFWPLGGNRTPKQADRHSLDTVYCCLIKLMCQKFPIYTFSNICIHLKLSPMLQVELAVVHVKAELDGPDDPVTPTSMLRSKPIWNFGCLSVPIVCHPSRLPSLCWLGCCWNDFHNKIMLADKQISWASTG